ncbi:MAG: DUF4265 domain-containing protein [Planctomycetes bacterium]|nr:DUF4265 domain-containing protein [Planctomycetota bacterium]
MGRDRESVVETGEDDARVEFPEQRVTESLEVTRIGSRQYRLDSVPVFAEGYEFGDVVVADEVEPGHLRVFRIVSRSCWRNFDYCLTAEALDSERIRGALMRVDEIGGYWERIFGGILYVCILPGVDFNPTTDFVG